jgi:hypothetical protein
MRCQLRRRRGLGVRDWELDKEQEKKRGGDWEKPNPEPLKPNL